MLRRNWEDFTGFCPTHEISGRTSRRQAYAAIQELQAQAQNGSAQKDGSAEKHSGGRPRDLQALEMTKDTICEMRDELKSLGKITYSAIAVKLQLKKAGVSAKGVEQRLKRGGYTGEREDIVLAVLKERGKG